MKNESTRSPDQDEIESFGDPDIYSGDRPVPKFLLWTYLLLPFWGLIVFFFFWNGSLGWFDRGYWAELQTAADTKYPYQENS